MNTSKHLSSVALFPLCDARNVLRDALRDTSNSTATRGDALVFAWRLTLPKKMNVAHAANAVLLSALSVPRSAWSHRQLLIIRELMVLAGRDEALPSEPIKNGVKPTLSKPVGQRRAATVNGDAVDSPAENQQVVQQQSVAKQDKDWWRLVGRGNVNDTSGQRKTRSERASQEP